jgi:hypothetical protein
MVSLWSRRKEERRPGREKPPGVERKLQPLPRAFSAEKGPKERRVLPGIGGGEGAPNDPERGSRQSARRRGPRKVGKRGPRDPREGAQRDALLSWQVEVLPAPCPLWRRRHLRQTWGCLAGWQPGWTSLRQAEQRWLLGLLSPGGAPPGGPSRARTHEPSTWGPRAERIAGAWEVPRVASLSPRASAGTAAWGWARARLPAEAAGGNPGQDRSRSPAGVETRQEEPRMPKTASRTSPAGKCGGGLQTGG